VNISRERLLNRLEELARIGAIPDTHGNSRLALTDDDRDGRDLVKSWMEDLGLSVTIDGIGNVIATTDPDGGPPVMTGSHIDTVATGGRYDGVLGVLAGLEVIETVLSAGITPARPLAVGFFTDEEGARFPPDMLGSLVYVGGMSVEEALDATSADGAVLGEELERIGYRGSAPVPGAVPHAFVELHIEQGPVLEAENVQIGAVEGVQGISWTEITIEGQSNHAGTTPIGMRRDPGLVAAQIAAKAREVALQIGGTQVATVGSLRLSPDLVNVVPAQAVMTLDLRNTDEGMLVKAEAMMEAFWTEAARAENVSITTRSLARFEPVVFDPRVVDIVEATAVEQGLVTKRMPSGAGHDAQMMARICPTAMIFVPSVDGLSHNPAEFTHPDDLEAGANVLLHTMLRLAEME